MITRIPLPRKLGMLFALLLLSSVFGGRAQAAATTTFLNETFSGTAVPKGWTADVNSTWQGWYWNYDGAGVPGGGAAMTNLFYLQNPNYAYGYYPPFENNLWTPTMNLSTYGNASDSIFVEFDVYLSKNYYNLYYSGVDGKLEIYAVAGKNTNKLKTLSENTDAPNTYYDYYYGPAYYYSTWKHYKIQVPSDYAVSNLQILFKGVAASTYPYNYYNYSDDIAIDNVKLTAARYNFIAVSPTSLNFGSLGTGLQSNPQSVVITNPTTVPITVSNVKLVGSVPGDYQIVSSPSIIPAGGKDSIRVRFVPTAKGLRLASVTFNTNSDNYATAQVDLTGTGLVPTIQLSASPLTLFSKRKVRFDNSVMESFTVKNTGGSPLIISAGSNITGDYPDQYKLVSYPTLPIAPGSLDTIKVSFNPTIEGSRPAYLNIKSNADNGTQVVTLKGIGILPRLYATPSPLTFDSVRIGESLCKKITILNPGSDTLALTRNFFTSADPDFTMTPIKGTDTLILPDRSRDIEVCFTPRFNGTRRARLRLTTNIPLSYDLNLKAQRIDTGSFDIDITAVGVPSGKLDFSGSTALDSVLVDQEVCHNDTIWNRGTVDITVNSAVISGTDASMFTITNVPTSIMAGKSAVVTICAKPASRGLHADAVLTVVGKANEQSSNIMVPLGVYGLYACGQSDQTALFSTSRVLVGMNEKATIEITNCGEVPMVYAAALAAGSSADYALTGAATSTTVAPGDKAMFDVTFTPTARGTANGTLNITAAGIAPISVTLGATGTGVALSSTPTVPDVMVGLSQNFDVQVMNNGNTDWTPGTPAVTGAYTFVSGPTTVAAGTNGTFTLTFTPTAEGTNAGTVKFPMGAPTEIPAGFTIDLSGKGLSPLGVKTIAQADGYALEQNFPNPFNPTTQITFSTPRDARVTINVIDLTGRVLKTVFDGKATAGQHSITLDASNLPSGTYFYELTSGATRLVRSMVLSK